MPDRRPSHPAIRRASTRFTFLPLSEDRATISTRGQRLGSIIRNQSTTSLSNMRFGSYRARSRADGAQEDDPESGRPGTRGSDESDSDEDEANTAGAVPQPPPNFPLVRSLTMTDVAELNRRKPSAAEKVLATANMRSQRLIGNSNPRYKWEQYWKTEAELKAMKKPLRKYYERNNFLIQQYLYIDRLLDSSLAHDLVAEYGISVPKTIQEEDGGQSDNVSKLNRQVTIESGAKVKRTKDIFKVSDEQTPLISSEECGEEVAPKPSVPMLEFEDEAGSGDKIVTVAIYINFAANAILLILKIIVTVLTSSLSVLASLVDAALDFLSTFIVWTTSRLISGSKNDLENYPVGRQRLEPLGVLVFSVIMITSFVQVGIEAINRLMSNNHEIVQLTIPAIAIMSTTVVIKFMCWLWCRLIKNSSVQALAQDAMTDVVFNIFSIIFPLIGYYARIWWMDPLGGLLLSLYVIFNWSITTKTHILNLTGKVSDADERNILLYLTMRFAHTIRYIQALKAYHAGDKLNVEVDVVLDEDMNLRDSHDLTESLQYVLESVPGVERAFVHADYRKENLPSHMQQ